MTITPKFEPAQSAQIIVDPDATSHVLRPNADGSVNATVADAGAAAAAVSLAIIDDWDENDRAKVNPIAGQAGVAAGAGAVTALTQRVTAASDDPAVAALGATTGAKVVTDANGTIQQYLRGVVTFLANALGAGTAAAAIRHTLASDDPAVTVLGAQADAASATTSIKAALRGLATALGTAAWTFGAGAVGATTPRVTLASDDPAVTKLASVLSRGTMYETVAASQTAQVMGGAGAVGDFIAGILVVPASANPGNILLLDNATSITVFVGGTASIVALTPFYIPLNLLSVSGAWKITTGASVSCVVSGTFT